MPIDDPWLGPVHNLELLTRAGFKLVGGGTHQSKTLMLADLQALWDLGDKGAAQRLIIEDNVLGKRSKRARDVALYRLNQLFGIVDQPLLTRYLAAVWHRDRASQPMLALLCALARDPSLRDAAKTVLDAPIGAPVRWPIIAAAYDGQHPGRLGAKMLKSFAQNCASTFTQSGFLRGKLAKIRIRASATPNVAAFAGLLAELAGFGGPSLLLSPWLDVLDQPVEGRVRLLQSAADMGLLRLRTGGDIVEIAVRERMASTLGLPPLGDL